LSCPLARSAGVENPPAKPSRAMKTESRRIDSRTATTVTSAIIANAVSGSISFHRPYAA
jgi:hypothetical protein